MTLPMLRSQTLSVMGGLMLLALHGPCGISLDKGAKKSI